MEKGIFHPNSQEDRISSKIVVGLERIAEAFRVLLWEEAKQTGLSPIQIQILVYILNHPDYPSSVSSLANEFNLSKATVSDAVKSLSVKELVRKFIDETDKRSSQIQITSKGIEICSKVEHFANPIRSVVESMDRKSQIQLSGMLSELIHGMHVQEILRIQRMCFTCRHYAKTHDGHYCNFLQKKLRKEEIRIDCPEHVLN